MASDCTQDADGSIRIRQFDELRPRGYFFHRPVSDDGEASGSEREIIVDDVPVNAEGFPVKIDVSAANNGNTDRKDFTLKQIPVSLLKELGKLINTLSEDPAAYAQFQSDPQKFLGAHPTLGALSSMMGGRNIKLVKDDSESLNIVIPEKTRFSTIDNEQEKEDYLVAMGFAAVGSCHMP